MKAADLDDTEAQLRLLVEEAEAHVSHLAKTAKPSRAGMLGVCFLADKAGRLALRVCLELRRTEAALVQAQAELRDLSKRTSEGSETGNLHQD